MVTASAPARQQFSLRRGRIHALHLGRRLNVSWWRRHRRAPSTWDANTRFRWTITATDLLDVQTGWVAFQFGGRERLYLPAGAACRTQKLAAGCIVWRSVASVFETAEIDADASIGNTLP